MPYFGLTGAFLAKFNRYMIPILPFALLFAAALVWRLWRVETGSAGWRRGPSRQDRGAIRRRHPGHCRSAGGFFWSLAYVNGVYGGSTPG